MAHQFSTHSKVAHQSLQKTTENLSSSQAASSGFKRKQSSSVPVQAPQLQNVSCSAVWSTLDETNKTVTGRLPPNVDPEVFKLLPKEIQEELLSLSDMNSPPNTLKVSASLSSPVAAVDSSTSESIALLCPPPSKHVPQTFLHSQNLRDRKGSVKELDSSDRVTTMNHQGPPGSSAVPGEKVKEEGRLSSDCDFPGNVDPKVFSELPTDVQRELMSEWKQQKPILKTPTSRKPSKGSINKDKKAGGRGQANSLLKYFKPS